MQRRFQIIRGGLSLEKKLTPQSGFEESLIAHLDSLLGFAMRLAGGKRGHAEDMVQETCLRAFKNRKSLRSLEKIKPWLFQILYNTHINEFHRMSREPPVVDIELSEALLESCNLESRLTPEAHLFEQLLDSEIQQALDELPIEFRTAVWLADVEGFSYKEISEIANCPVGTVASRIFRGHNILRERLRSYATQRGLARE
ncbi:MAG: sigma-70 family RNA polymerase sigma factor [Acidobacteriota bacterium]